MALFDTSANWPALSKVLAARTATAPVTKVLVLANLMVFVAMLFNGAGFWHSPNAVQLAWGANFGPATQDGEWWRLASALFLHFGVVHLTLNLWALWDGGQLVERMYGHVRFVAIYFISGLSGNLLSLVVQGNLAVSGGASSAIFGVYGALLVFLWTERQHLDADEFRWLFWGAAGFSVATIILGFIVPAIDNAAHIGGFFAGVAAGFIFARPLVSVRVFTASRIAATVIFLLAIGILIYRIPQPSYKWSDELLIQQEINDFVKDDQALNREWLKIIHESKQGNVTYYDLAVKIDNAITDRYEEHFEQLSQLPYDPSMPSANKLESVLQYTQQKRDASRALADKLRDRHP
ncbi:MAG: rhomboid family intramembrane serine protease [Methylophilaceae bacterium]